MPLGPGRRCPFCALEGLDVIDHDEQKLRNETKEILAARRAARREEIAKTKQISDKVKQLWSLDRKIYTQKYYTPRGKKALRAQQAMWLTEQIEMILGLFEMTPSGTYEVYAEDIALMQPQITELKRRLPMIMRTFIVRPRETSTDGI